MPDPCPDAPVRVVIVDADHRVRESLADLVGVSGSLEVVGAASHPGGALEQVAATSPDVVVLDPRLPDVDAGLALITLLATRDPRPCLLVLTSLGCELDVLARGADGFLPKSIAPQELIDAIVALACTARARNAAERPERREGPSEAPSATPWRAGMPAAGDEIPSASPPSAALGGGRRRSAEPVAASSTDAGLA